MSIWALFFQVVQLMIPHLASLEENIPEASAPGNMQWDHPLLILVSRLLLLQLELYKLGRSLLSLWSTEPEAHHLFEALIVLDEVIHNITRRLNEESSVSPHKGFLC